MFDLSHGMDAAHELIRIRMRETFHSVTRFLRQAQDDNVLPRKNLSKLV